jgi:Mg-chelatase subunit ChlD
VVLVIDTSFSMKGAKVEAAARAARTFVRLLNLPRDHAAVVTFSRTATLVQQLTGDGRALLGALAPGRLTIDNGTRIDLGLWEGLDAIGGPNGRPEADPVLILLTDGYPSEGSAGSARTAAAIGRDLGVAIYSIGLGDEVDVALLTDIAGDPGRVHLAPDAADLERIYEQVARLIPCR